MVPAQAHHFMLRMVALTVFPLRAAIAKYIQEHTNTQSTHNNCNLCAGNAQTIHSQFTVNTQSIHSQHPVNSLSTPSQVTVNTQSICNQYKANTTNTRLFLQPL